MSQLLEKAPYDERDDRLFLEEMRTLSRYHLAGCPEYARVWPGWQDADRVEDLPFLHVGLFKQLSLTTQHEDVRHERTLLSSSTSGQGSSRIALDTRSSALQTRSSLAILQDYLGANAGGAGRKLLVLDHPSSLRRRGEVSARVAAAMSLRPLADDLYFLLGEPENPASLKTEFLAELLAAVAQGETFLVYGFTWMLYLAWNVERFPAELRAQLAGRRVDFVHSGGWKKLEAMRVSCEEFDARLLAGLDPGSQVLDFYGLVEQVGVVYPLCPAGYRHVPRWAEVIIRDPYTLAAKQPGEGEGQLQLMNTLALGAPYHNVLTEDVARLEPEGCACGRSGQRFSLLGRVPKSESRGCANV